MALPSAKAQGLNEVLQTYTREGKLYEKLEGGRVRCFSCGHRCVIPKGKAGICLVRYNEGGTLKVPHGYVGSLQLDPVEKKPFFHAYPGSLAMSFGMLGCDFHCGYCVGGETLIPTSNGPKPIADLFADAQIVSETKKAAVAESSDLKVYSHTGTLRKVRQLFRHPYEGRLIVVKPRYLPEIQLTPEHELLVFRNGTTEFVRAGEVSSKDRLVIPKNFSFSESTTYNTSSVLSPFVRPIRVRRSISPALIGATLDLSQEGYSSRDIGFLVGKDSSHVRHLRSKIRSGVWQLDDLFHRPGGLIVKEEKIRFIKEHAPGIPHQINLDENLARLIGYYLAEGCVIRNPKRVLSAELVFSLGRHEKQIADEIQGLIRSVLGIKPSLSWRPTTLCVSLTKSSAAHFFLGLCGTGSKEKRIPEALFNAPRDVVEAFIEAYAKGDGHRYRNGKMALTTVSPQLAMGLTWLLLKTGRFPAVYIKEQKPYGMIQKRRVRQAPRLFMVVWYPDASKRKWVSEDARNFHIGIESIRRRPFQGHVYNIEVDQDHTYLAQFVATHNCQNWYTSQALRDPNATAHPIPMTPAGFTSLAKQEGARIVTTTYNEPLITSEWAVEIFKTCKKEGLITSYVSNGNGTPEVLEYIRPWVDLYKVDLKGFQDKHYRELGGVLPVVLDTIQRLYRMGFWLEIVTLVIPGFNDSEGELRDMAKFLAGVSKDIPWHITAFHKDYKMQDRDNTPDETLIRAYDIGKEEGLHFVYPGNRPGRVGDRESTFCPSCNAKVIERVGYRILGNTLKPGGACPKCDTKIPGRWN